MAEFEYSQPPVRFVFLAYLIVSKDFAVIGSLLVFRPFSCFVFWTVLHRIQGFVSNKNSRFSGGF